MKFNWVNLLATLLIIGGVCLLVEKRMHGTPARHVPTVEEAKLDIQHQIEGKLGRQLSDAETDMIDVTKSGEQINITLHQPLTGRLMKALHDAKSATAASAAPGFLTPPPPRDGVSGYSSLSTVHTPAMGATTVPTTGLP